MYGNGSVGEEIAKKKKFGCNCKPMLSYNLNVLHRLQQGVESVSPTATYSMVCKYQIIKDGVRRAAQQKGVQRTIHEKPDGRITSNRTIQARCTQHTFLMPAPLLIVQSVRGFER